jgi:hypothetical protein
MDVKHVEVAEQAVAPVEFDHLAPFRGERLG